jgi:hypothetical protein
MRKTKEQAQATIEKIVKRYSSPLVRNDLESMLSAVMADDEVRWEQVCAANGNFGYVDHEDAWEQSSMLADFYTELTGRTPAFVVCELDEAQDDALTSIIQGTSGEGAIQALLDNIRNK